MSDLILKSKNIYIGKGNEIISGFVVIEKNKIIKVGEITNIEKYINSKTKVLDLKDKLIIPGLNDSHLHFFMSGLYASPKVKISFTDKSEEECVNSLKEIENLNSKDEWMIGAGWYHPLWDNPSLPTKHSLDKVYPDRPVCMISYDCHTLWINSFGLKKLGIDANFPDIQGGIIDRDLDGEPLGTFHEAAYSKILQSIYDFDDEYIKSFYEDFIKKLNSYGITSVSDLSMMAYPGADFIRDDIFTKLEKENKLNVRVHMFPTLTEDLSRVKKMRDTYKGPFLYCNGAKQFFDGVSSCHTAWIKEPYSNAYFEGDCGKPTMEPEKMRQIILNAHKNNFSVRVHTIGDKAIHKMIDYIIEAEEKYGKNSNLQHCLEHLENLQKDDIKRLADNNIVLAVQPAHAVYDYKGVERDLGKERTKLMWPFRTEIDAGCVLAFGTDSPVVDINPFYGIYNAVTRKNTFSKLPKEGWHSEQNITAFEAVSAYTYGSSISTKSENFYGTLEENKLADICVLDTNILVEDFEKIPNTNCVLTIVDGKIVYQRNN